MLFRVIFCLNNTPFFTPKQTIDNLREDSITARTAHLIELLDIGEVFTIVKEGEGTYLVIRVE